MNEDVKHDVGLHCISKSIKQKKDLLQLQSLLSLE